MKPQLTLAYDLTSQSAPSVSLGKSILESEGFSSISELRSVLVRCYGDRVVGKEDPRLLAVRFACVRNLEDEGPGWEV